MEQYQNRLDELKEIRQLMESSTRFLSLSGLSGVGAGLVALLGAGWVYRYLLGQGLLRELVPRKVLIITYEQFYTLVGMALVILIAAVACGIFFTVRNSKKKGLPVWSKATQRLLINLFIPLISGAIFCLLLAWHGFSSMIPAATLIFYGMGLLNAGKYTYREIRYLGISEIILGLIASFSLEYGIIFWAFGFGVLHIAYGTLMYFNYER